MKIFQFFTILILLSLVSATIIEFVEAEKLRNKDDNNKKKGKRSSSGAGVSSTPEPEPHKPKPKKAPAKKKATTGATPEKGQFKPGKPKYTEIVDLAIDHAKNYCSTLGPLINRPKFSWKRRCDVFYEAVEMFITGFSDTMINEFDLTQQEMVNRALSPVKLQELKSALKTTARRALESTKTDEKKLQTHLNAKLSQWIMNLAIGKEGSGSSGGNMMGAFGGGLAFGDGITEEDKRWAEEVSADDYEDDPEKDDPDFIHKQSRGQNGGMPNVMDSQGNPLPKDKVDKMMKGMKEEQAKRDAIDSEEAGDL
jgi:hypothetical protein